MVSFILLASRCFADYVLNLPLNDFHVFTRVAIYSIRNVILTRNIIYNLFDQKYIPHNQSIICSTSDMKGEFLSIIFFVID